MKVPAQYNVSVFINCPFDSQYDDPLFDAVVFAIYDCGFKPRCTREKENSGITRIQSITELIKQCRLAFHDLSRVELSVPEDGTAPKGLPHFNMPLELGMFMGAKEFGAKRHKLKNCIIFGKEQRRYQRFISDIAGQDIKAHGNDPSQVIRGIRNWLAPEAQNLIPGGKAMVARYTEFHGVLPSLAKNAQQEVEELRFTDYIAFVEAWLKANPS